MIRVLPLALLPMLHTCWMRGNKLLIIAGIVLL